MIRRRADPTDAIARDLPDVARAIARACAAGLPVSEAVARAGDAVDDDAALLLHGCADALRAGDATRSALAPLAAVPGGMLIVGAIELHDELGGDLVASLFAIAEGLADRERMRLEAKAATAQARLAARVVPLDPVASIGFLAILAPSACVALVTTAPGLAILTVAATLTGVALLALRRISRGIGL